MKRIQWLIPLIFGVVIFFLLLRYKPMPATSEPAPSNGQPVQVAELPHGRIYKITVDGVEYLTSDDTDFIIRHDPKGKP